MAQNDPIKISAVDFKTRVTPGAEVARTPEGSWRLSIPAGPAGRYRLAQLDDYTHLPRRNFRWNAPVRLSLRARASAALPPGTWGFGLWNDPFSLSLGLQGSSRRLPALPNAAWFFFASPPNALSLRDELPSRGPLAASFRAPAFPAPVLAFGLVALPFLVWPPSARWLRRLSRRLIQEDAATLSLDVESGSAVPWLDYALDWTPEQVSFWLDGKLVLQTNIAPKGPLGLVVWVDNQYAALPPDGRLKFGTLPNPEPASIEVADLSLSQGGSL